MLEAGRLFIPTATIILVILRLSGVSGEVFQAAAHLFVGALIGGAIATRSPDDRRMLVSYTVILSVVETACFVASRVTHA